ncbi:MAG: transposase [Pirellulales bacterium]|nr:transposase [Pirellulales bacterium]
MRLITSDDHAGLRAALQARFAGVPWQRCQITGSRESSDCSMPNVPQTKRAAICASVLTAPNARVGSAAGPDGVEARHVGAEASGLVGGQRAGGAGRVRLPGRASPAAADE